MSNRQSRRKFWKAYKKQMGLGTWQEFNDTCRKQMPYVNPEKKHKYD